VSTKGAHTPAASLALSLQKGLYELRKDPLKHSRAASEAARQLQRWINECEVYFRAANSAGKTHAGARIGIALARGLASLDGIPLPQLGLPNTGWVLTQSYKQQVDASQKSYLMLLGEHPHHIAYVQGKGKGYVDTIWIATPLCKHGMGEQCSTCSKIVFHCEESTSSVGGRIDWAHADEPPRRTVWNEIRLRKQKGKKIILYITATPKERERYQWLQDEFTECTVYESKHVTGDVERFGKPNNSLAEIRCTIYDNEFLTDDDIDYFESKAKLDDFCDAILRGDYVDLAGKCPFNAGILQQKWLPRCQDPKIERVVVQAEQNMADGRHIIEIPVNIEIFKDSEKGRKYLGVIDPSAGINSKTHDPAGLLIISRDDPVELVARYNGYLGSFGMGSLGALLARRYNNCDLDIDMGGGYGQGVLLGLSAARYHRILHDADVDKPGYDQSRLGFRISASNRGELIASVQQAVVEDNVLIRSRAVVQCLLNVTIDESGNPKNSRAKKGRFDEDMICLGRALYLLSLPGMRVIRRQQREEAGVFARKRHPHSAIRERW
jgi:hypothetical protein